MRGIDKERAHVLIPDRREAIRYAIANAKRGDAVVLAGKGHETYEITAEGRRFFDERAIAKEALREFFPQSDR
jgi:UDP-N-acetylmuramoyl-L-alanyl-D-glutamate--2,6-diaminopimelate ligase